MFSTFDPSERCVRCCQVVYNLDSFRIVLNCVNISVLIARSFPEFPSKMFQIPFSVSELPNVFRVFPSIFHLIVAWTINERAYISVVTTNEKAKSTETTQQQIHARSKFTARLEFHFGGNVFVTKKKSLITVNFVLLSSSSSTFRSFLYISPPIACCPRQA